MRSASASAELPLRGGGGQHDGGAQRPVAAPEAPEHGGKGEDGDAGGLPMGLVIEGSATLALAIREPDEATTAPLEFNDDEKLTCRNDHEIASYCQPTVRNFACDSCPEFLMHDGDLIETPRPPAGMLMLGCRT
jgi:hypothetical protein